MATQTTHDTHLAPDHTRLRPPPFYKVVLLNDDETPMDFVVNVLQRFFGMDEARATYVMLQVHEQGRGICGLYTHDIAATKVEHVRRHAQEARYPLQCIMEEN